MYRALMTLSLAGLLAGATGATFAQEPAQPDNTKINKRDRQADEPTADQQKENGSDRDLRRTCDAQS